MRMQFVERPDAPERLVCDGELLFDGSGPLEGMKLVGFSLWRGADGEVRVTFPARAFGAAEQRRFFDFLRSTQGQTDDVRRVKAWILDEFRAGSRPA